MKITAILDRDFSASGSEIWGVGGSFIGNTVESRTKGDHQL